MILRHVVLAGAFLFYMVLTACAAGLSDGRSLNSGTSVQADVNPGKLIPESPAPMREMRGVWLTTVVNLDWPSRRDLSTEEQKREMTTLLDQLQEAGYNAVLFQVRSEGDAMFPSPYEPWSYWLSGEQGKAPSPFYDPLRFFITEAHYRGMEAHAWLNPYRTHRNLTLYPQHETHIARTRPDWILEFKTDSGVYQMLNPAIGEVRDFIANIVTDLVRRYDLDGIHFDDYFYPYAPAITNEDSLFFAADPRGFEDTGDWRRDNIDLMVRQVSDSIRAADPFVKFGISPFGIRLNSDAGTSGAEGYHMIYADPLNWLKEHTIDYITPQLYWDTEHPQAPHEPLLRWWNRAAAENDRHIYVGLAPYRINAPFNWPVNQLGKQIHLYRTDDNPAQGSVFFRAKSVTANPGGLKDSLRTRWFGEPALVPQMPWMPEDIPSPVEELRYEITSGHEVRLSWRRVSDRNRFAIFRLDDGIPDGNPDEVDLEDQQLLSVTGELFFATGERVTDKPVVFAVAAVGRNNDLSTPRLIVVDPNVRVD